MKPILVINDDPELLGMMIGLLKDGNFVHLAASSGEQVMTQASGYDFSLAVLDLKLPDMDGDELYDKLLFQESHYDLPIVALVDSMDADEVKVLNRLLPKGKVTLLSKPLKPEWLIELFEQYGERKKF